MKILVPVKRVVDYNVKIRVAAKLDVMQISEITKVVSPDTFERPGYAGNAVLTMQSAEAKKVIFVKKVFHKHFAHRHHRYIGTGLLLAGGGYYAYNNGCYWLKVRAINTGSEYWWDRYHACRGE